MHYLKVNRSLQ